MLKIDKVRVPAQSENSSNAEIHLETKQKNVLSRKGSNVQLERHTTATILLPVSVQNRMSMKSLED